MNNDVFGGALQARVEVLASPIEHAIKVDPVKITGCAKTESDKYEILIFLRLGSNPKDVANWCSKVLKEHRSFKVKENSKVFVQKLEAYPSDIAMFAANHALVFCDHYNFEKPNLKTLLFENFLDSEYTKCIIYSVKPSFKIVLPKDSRQKSKIIQGIGDSFEEALEKAKKKLPENMEIIKTRELNLAKPGERVITVEADDENSALAISNKRKMSTSIIKSILLTNQGEKGFWGIGKKHNTYEVKIFNPYIVELTVKDK